MWQTRKPIPALLALLAMLAVAIPVHAAPPAAPTDLRVGGFPGGQMRIAWADQSGDETTFSLVPMLRVGTQGQTLCVEVNAPFCSHAERGSKEAGVLSLVPTLCVGMRAGRSAAGQRQGFRSHAEHGSE